MRCITVREKRRQFAFPSSDLSDHHVYNGLRVIGCAHVRVWTQASNEVLFPSMIMSPITPFSVTCECGARFPVSPAQAGSNFDCTCGRVVDVPPLSHFRKAQGKDNYESGIVDSIERMIREETLPSQQACLFSGKTTTDTLAFNVELESMPKSENKTHIFHMLFSLRRPLRFLLNFFAYGRHVSESQLGHGREQNLIIIARISAVHHSDLRNGFSQPWIKRVLAKEPAYERLFAEYPDAVVKVAEQAGR